jgi:pseudaminic acid cytidylyltransferase
LTDQQQHYIINAIQPTLMNVAVIPARGGSKRIPRKNIREFAGKPMIAHSIECAIKSDLFSRLIVSTDDEEVAEIALAFGAEVPFRRPPELSDDQATTTAVMAHSVKWLMEQSSDVSAVCCIYATAPFIRPDDLKRGLAVLESGRWEYVFSATDYAFPVFRSFHKNTAGGLKMLFPEHSNTRSQDLPEVFHDAAQFYWGRPHAWLQSLQIFDVHSTMIFVPRWRVQDIDTEEDWIRAEAMMQYVASIP